MKKVIFLLVICLTCTVAYAQQNTQCILVSGTEQVVKTFGAAKATSSPGRWYNYSGDYLWRRYLRSPLSWPYLWSAYSYREWLWNDTSSTSLIPAPGGGDSLVVNHMVSYGALLQPWFSGFNDTATFGRGIVAVTAIDSYIVDSIEIIGDYFRNSSLPATPDTLRVSWEFGNGTTPEIYLGRWAGPIGPVVVGGFMSFLAPKYDSLHNCANWTNHVDVLLTPGDVSDTDAFYRGGSKTYIGACHRRVAIPPVTVPAGSYFATSVTFRCGIASAPAMPPGHINFSDTVWTGHAPDSVKWSMFRPWIGLNADSIGNALWPDTSNFNEGFYRSFPTAFIWAGLYIPGAAYNGPSGFGSIDQFGMVGFHLNCPTCATAGIAPSVFKKCTDLQNLAIVPNPANNEVSISFTQANSEVAYVSLINMVGQVVASQIMSNGKAVFNTSALPEGVYNYSVKADGQTATGRVVIAH